MLADVNLDLWGSSTMQGIPFVTELKGKHNVRRPLNKAELDMREHAHKKRTKKMERSNGVR